MEPTVVIIISVAAVAGVVAAVLASRRGRRRATSTDQDHLRMRAVYPDEREQMPLALQEELKGALLERDNAREQWHEAEKALAAERAEHQTRAQERDKQTTNLQAELQQSRLKRDDILQQLRKAEKELAAERAEHQARVQELAQARKSLDTEFKGLAAGVLRESTQSLLKQAKEQFSNHLQLSDTELAKREKAINNLVLPIQKSLEELGAHTREFEKDRIGAYNRLVSQIKTLQETTGGLSEALRSPNIRGQWAEQELLNILELSGLHQHIDFHPQHTISLADGQLRPDAVVNVPGGLKVIIDAKAPMENYLKAQEADSKEQRDLLLKHATAFSQHAKTLGGRDYAAALAGSPDFVLMFVPADPILDSAMKVQPTLWEDAWQKHRVLIATPGLLLAFLRTVAVAWQQQDMQEHAQEIASLGLELYDRLRVFAGHLEDMGSGLGKALTAYNNGVGSLESRVLVQARRFEDMVAVPDAKTVPKVERIEKVVRPLSAIECQDDERALFQARA